MSVFKGAGVAIITPFLENGDVNYDKLAEIIELQIKNGTDSIVICGTTGESACLTEEEHIECIRFAVKQVNKRVPVIAGAGSNCTRTAVYLSEEAEKAGADALLLVTPYYNKTTQAGLIDHYTTVANSVNIPIILYNVKSRTGVNIEPETCAHLVKNVPNIVGIKEASGDISQITKLKAICPEVELYSGNDDQVVPILSVGGLGVISVVSNVAPRYMHDLVMKYLSGDVQGSAKMQLDVIELVEALFCETNPIPVKHAMNLMGMQVGPLRKPLVSMAPANLERLRTAMKNFGLIQA
ncbi:MAG: 4-hydroxy-tetrahydrodipicolinate synthase [Lachnospiraceae bacterium]|nr:4-hydroxy-tetrahydrodipicolinate synthase [Lachnospiraceae bacterium]MDN4742199.1 4-hydroxy-tetrahydrodipicolinate synthase [Lachnospiraceae bacterium C1.1]